LAPQRVRGPARLAYLAAVGVALLVSPAAAADPSAADKETSRSLYAQGMQALDSHDFSAAERACGGAHALVKAPTSAACWARALEGIGRLVEARDEFLEAAHFPVRPDEPAVFATAREASRREADQLAKRIPTVTLSVSGPDASALLRVTFDGATVAPETARLPRKANPGRHTIAVVAKGFEPITTEVEVSEGEDRRVPVPLVRLTPKEVAGRPAQHETQQAAPTTTQGANPVPVLPIVVGGVGAIGLAVGVATGLAAASKHTALKGECSGSACPSLAQADLDAFHSMRTLSAVGYVVGAIGVVGGAALWYFAPSRPSDASATVSVGPGSAGATGAF